jgi:HSP20 family molecular chaperone IbpA
MMQGHHRGEMHEMRQHGGHMQGQRGGEMMHGDMQKDRSALEQQHGAVAGSTGMMGSMPSSGGGGMMQQKDMGMQKMGQPQQRNQLTPQEIDDDQIGRMRQKGYCPLDLIQEPTRYVALFDLPGVYRDQIALCIDRGMLKMTVHRPENAAYPHHKHHRQPQQQESGMTQQPNPQFQGQAQSGGFGKVTVEDEQEDDFDVGVLKGIEHAYQRDMEKRQRAQLQTSQIHDNSGSTLAAPKPGSGMGAGNAGPSAEMRKSPNILPPGGQYLCRERPHGRIDRFIRLPHDIEETLSDAKLENGVLSVSIGRRAHHQRGGQQQMGAR